MKKQLTIAGIILMTGIFILPMASFGRGGKDGFFPGKNMRMTAPQAKASNLTAEQISQIEELHKKFRDENAETLKQLMSKRFDLGIIFDSDNPDLAKAKAIQKEISDLDAKLAQKNIDLFGKILKINPNAKFHGGMERGHRMKGM